ncbi:MAG: putative transcription regulator [Thermoleophilia bacterium]|nr:putative transcription regulator [Thermoleophilia bacterium]
MFDNPYETETPMPWMQEGAPQASCAEANAESWFPETGKYRAPEALSAVRICHDCPLQAACLEWAISEVPLTGIWGGIGPTERRRLHAGRQWRAARDGEWCDQHDEPVWRCTQFGKTHVVLRQRVEGQA